MKKHSFCLFTVALFISFSLAAQTTDRKSQGLTDGQVNQLSLRVFKARNPMQDKSDQFEIQGLGGTTFTASNTSDGTANSYRHSLQITVSLLPVNKPANSTFQLLFYSESENIQQAASYNDGVLNIYYPINLYQDIKEKLEQSIAAKKKVYIKVIQKTDGYREGSLIF